MKTFMADSAFGEFLLKLQGYKKTEHRVDSIANIIMLILLLCAIALVLCGCNCRACFADTGTASWFSRESCIKEGSSTVMSNGKELVDESYICASWFYPIGTRLLVVCLGSGKAVRVVVTTRGPVKRLVEQGRIIDLSPAAFAQLDVLSRGAIKVRVRKI